MSNIFEILEFTFNKRNFVSSATNLISSENIEKRNRLIYQLNQISESVVEPHNFNYEDIVEVYNNFIQLKEKPTELEEYFNKKRRIKKLCSALGHAENGCEIISNNSDLNLALSLIDKYFSNSMNLLLFEIILKKWHHPQVYRVNNFIKDKLKGYGGNNKLLTNIKKNYNYFEKDNGTNKLASYILVNNILLSDITNNLNLSERYINYEYFEDVCLFFTSSIGRLTDDIELIEDLISFLLKCHNHNLSKKCLSIITIAKKDTTNINIKERLKSAAIQLIGDPVDNNKWNPWKNASNRDKEELKQAQEILNEWINRKLLETFFRVLVIDDDRKNFWINYYSKAKRLKIYIHHNSLWKLKNDKNISSYLTERVGILDYSGSNQSALILEFNKYVLVEFSVKGSAFYAYKTSNSLCPDVNNKRISKNTLINYKEMKPLLKKGAYYAYDKKPEGRFVHFPGWQPFLTDWLRQFLNI